MAEEVGEVVADHFLQALEEVKEDKHLTSRWETEEQAGRGRRHQSWKEAEEAEGCQSQGGVGGLPCQRAGEEVEVQGEVTGWDERWAGVRTWGEQEVGGWDSAH